MYKLCFDQELQTFRKEEVDKETWDNRHELTGDKPWFWCWDKRNLGERIEKHMHELETGEIEIITCKDCGNDFMLKKSNIDWYDQQGFSHPTRCLACRRKRKAEREKRK